MKRNEISHLKNFNEKIGSLYESRLLVEAPEDEGKAKQLGKLALKKAVGTKTVEPEELAAKTGKLIGVKKEILEDLQTSLGTDFVKKGSDYKPVFTYDRGAYGKIVVQPYTDTYVNMYFLGPDGIVLAMAEMETVHLISALKNKKNAKYFKDVVIDKNITKVDFWRDALSIFVPEPITGAIAGAIKFFTGKKAARTNKLILSNGIYLPLVIRSMYEANFFDIPFDGIGSGPVLGEVNRFSNDKFLHGIVQEKEKSIRIMESFQVGWSRTGKERSSKYFSEGTAKIVMKMPSSGLLEPKYIVCVENEAPEAEYPSEAFDIISNIKFEGYRKDVIPPLPGYVHNKDLSNFAKLASINSTTSFLDKTKFLNAKVADLVEKMEFAIAKLIENQYPALPADTQLYPDELAAKRVGQIDDFYYTQRTLRFKYKDWGDIIPGKPFGKKVKDFIWYDNDTQEKELAAYRAFITMIASKLGERELLKMIGMGGKKTVSGKLLNLAIYFKDYPAYGDFITDVRAWNNMPKWTSTTPLEFGGDLKGYKVREISYKTLSVLRDIDDENTIYFGFLSEDPSNETQKRIIEECLKDIETLSK